MDKGRTAGLALRGFVLPHFLEEAKDDAGSDGDSGGIVVVESEDELVVAIELTLVRSGVT